MELVLIQKGYGIDIGWIWDGYGIDSNCPERASGHSGSWGAFHLDAVGEIGVVFETRKTKGRKYENSKRLSPLGCCGLNSPTASI